MVLHLASLAATPTRPCALPTTEDTQIVSADGFDISSSKRSKLKRKPDNVHLIQIGGGSSQGEDEIGRFKGGATVQYDIVCAPLKLNA